MANRAEMLSTLRRLCTGADPNLRAWAAPWYMRLLGLPDDHPAWAEFDAEVARYRAIALAITDAYRTVADRYPNAVDIVYVLKS